MVPHVLKETLQWVTNSRGFLVLDLKSDNLCQVFEMSPSIQLWDVWEMAFGISRRSCITFSYILITRNAEGYAI